MPEFAQIAAITVICFLIGMAAKASPINDKFIPVIVGCCGAILGVVGLYTMPSYPADNVIDALAVGIASGLAATGFHQIGKQLSEN